MYLPTVDRLPRRTLSKRLILGGLGGALAGGLQQLRDVVADRRKALDLDNAQETTEVIS